MPTIDLSRLKRRPVDVKSVKAQRFLFPGWEPCVYTQPNHLQWKSVTEQEWNAAPVTERLLVLDRGPETLRVWYTTKRPGYFDVKPCWSLHAQSMILKKAWQWHEVYFLQNVDFETLVRATERYLLLAHETYNTDVFWYMNGATNSGRDWARQQQLVDNLMRVWKQQPTVH